jgi:hypothetical protein
VNVNENAISVIQTAGPQPMQFTVRVSTEGTQTEHIATLSQPHCDRLTNGMCSPEKLVEASFAFLLDREAKESILRRFDIAAIEQYFPEFEEQLPQYLARLPNADSGRKA